MKNMKNNTTGEPVEGQATTTAENPAATSGTPTQKMLPMGYLSSGSILDADGIIIPSYLGKYAKELAQMLAPMKSSTFQRTFLTGAKEASKKKVAYGAKKNCAMGMVTQAKKLAARKKEPAPAMLVQMMTAVTATVKDVATFEALYMHLDAIYSYMLEQEVEKGLTE